MNTQGFLTVLILGAIAIFSGFIAYEFYKYPGGKERYLQILFVMLFATKVIVYGGTAVFLLFEPGLTMLQRLCLNAPMCVVMWLLYKHIVYHNNNP